MTPRPPLVAIGASAGGPGALMAVLRALPADFAGAMVVVQHLDHRFASSMATWLGEGTRLAVRVAADGDRPAAGVVLLAAGDRHLAFKSRETLGYRTAPADLAHAPSIDVFFDSACHWWTGRAAGVLLTGMGRDGAAGLRQMRQAGHYTIAQNEATSTVYGMPRAAVDLDAAVDVLPLDAIAGAIFDWSIGCRRPVPASSAP